MTQKSIAKECADWIKRKAKFKSNTTGEYMSGFVNVVGKENTFTYMPINEFTTVDIGCERGNNSYNMVSRIANSESNSESKSFIELFDEIWNDKEKLQDVTSMVIENITTAYNENSPELI